MKKSFAMILCSVKKNVQVQYTKLSTVTQKRVSYNALNVRQFLVIYTESTYSSLW